MLSCYGSLATNKSIKDTVRVGHLKCANRVGLAAGFDKDGTAIQGLSKVGFGFLELGGVTPSPQPGNRAPRVFRLKKDLALINRMGLNNDGVDALADKLKRSVNNVQIPIGVNIGRNWNTPNSRAAADYVYCFNQVKSVVDFVTINISSPNTPNLRDLQEQGHVMALLDEIVRARDVLANTNNAYVSLFVKVSPDLNVDETEALCNSVKNTGCDGIVATNTSVDRSTLSDRNRRELGGLSGAPLFARALERVTVVREAVGPDFTVIGCGGVSDGSSARQMVDAGANLVQIYSALVYRGPGCVAQIASALEGWAREIYETSQESSSARHEHQGNF